MSTELLPCPFCGSTNLRYEFAGSQGYIQCNECGTEGPCDERAADPICDIDAACAAWNRRAALAETELPAMTESNRQQQPTTKTGITTERLDNIRSINYPDPSPERRPTNPFTGRPAAEESSAAQPADGDWGGLAELCNAEGVDLRIGVPLLQRAREAWKYASHAACRSGAAHALPLPLPAGEVKHG